MILSLNKKKDPGSYILRFSKSDSKKIAMSYVTDNEETKHTLIEHDEEGFNLQGNNEKFISLQLLLGNHQQFFRKPIQIHTFFFQVNKF